MGSYEVSFRRSVLRDLKPIPAKDVARIVDAIRALAVNPRPPQCQKLSGQERYRIRQGEYRILNSIQDDGGSVWIVKVAHRKEAYR